MPQHERSTRLAHVNCIAYRDIKDRETFLETLPSLVAAGSDSPKTRRLAKASIIVVIEVQNSHGQAEPRAKRQSQSTSLDRNVVTCAKEKASSLES